MWAIYNISLSFRSFAEDAIHTILQIQFLQSVLCFFFVFFNLVFVTAVQVSFTQFRQNRNTVNSSVYSYSNKINESICLYLYLLPDSFGHFHSHLARKKCYNLLCCPQFDFYKQKAINKQWIEMFFSSFSKPTI